jgi:hypothetical protein
MFLNRLLLLLYIKVEGPIYEEELFKKNIWCHLRTLEHHFFCPVRHKIIVYYDTSLIRSILSHAWF